MDNLIQKPSRILAIGDIHGRHRALTDVLRKCKFADSDKLIIMGDVVDRGKKSKEVVSELIAIRNKVALMGNHDSWFINFFKWGQYDSYWLDGGGYETLGSYSTHMKNNSVSFDIPESHKKFFESMALYHIEGNGKESESKVFVHAGFHLGVHPKDEKQSTLIWNRDLVHYAKGGDRIEPWKLVFIGHTLVQTVKPDTKKPLILQNLVMLDCGAGYNKNLAIMDIESLQYWVSDLRD